MPDVVDPDDLSTWPDALRDALTPYAAGVPSDTGTTDIDAPSDAETLDLLDGRPLRAYHCTRLLPHEVTDISQNGLRTLSREHADGRIAAAVDVGALTDGQADRLRSTTVYGGNNVAPTGRVGRVCTVLGTTAFTEGARGVWRLLSRWGGEATYWHASDADVTLLRSLGVPSVVVLDLHLTDATVHVWPSVGQVLTSHLARLNERGGEAHRLAAVAGSDIVDLWQPGYEAYDRFPDLPGLTVA